MQTEVEHTEYDLAAKNRVRNYVHTFLAVGVDDIFLTLPAQGLEIPIVKKQGLVSKNLALVDMTPGNVDRVEEEYGMQGCIKYEGKLSDSVESLKRQLGSRKITAAHIDTMSKISWPNMKEVFALFRAGLMATNCRVAITLYAMREHNDGLGAAVKAMGHIEAMEHILRDSGLHAKVGPHAMPYRGGLKESSDMISFMADLEIRKPTGGLFDFIGIREFPRQKIASPKVLLRAPPEVVPKIKPVPAQVPLEKIPGYENMTKAQIAGYRSAATKKANKVSLRATPVEVDNSKANFSKFGWVAPTPTRQPDIISRMVEHGAPKWGKRFSRTAGLQNFVSGLPKEFIKLEEVQAIAKNFGVVSYINITDDLVDSFEEVICALIAERKKLAAKAEEESQAAHKSAQSEFQSWIAGAVGAGKITPKEIKKLYPKFGISRSTDATVEQLPILKMAIESLPTFSHGPAPKTIQEDLSDWCVERVQKKQLTLKDYGVMLLEFKVPGVGQLSDEQVPLFKKRVETVMGWDLFDSTTIAPSPPMTSAVVESPPFVQVSSVPSGWEMVQQIRSAYSDGVTKGRLGPDDLRWVLSCCGVYYISNLSDDNRQIALKMFSGEYGRVKSPENRSLFRYQRLTDDEDVPKVKEHALTVEVPSPLPEPTTPEPNLYGVSESVSSPVEETVIDVNKFETTTTTYVKEKDEEAPMTMQAMRRCLAMTRAGVSRFDAMRNMYQNGGAYRTTETQFTKMMETNDDFRAAMVEASSGTHPKVWMDFPKKKLALYPSGRTLPGKHMKYIVDQLNEGRGLKDILNAIRVTIGSLDHTKEHNKIFAKAIDLATSFGELNRAKGLRGKHKSHYVSWNRFGGYTVVRDGAKTKVDDAGLITFEKAA